MSLSELQKQDFAQGSAESNTIGGRKIIPRDVVLDGLSYNPETGVFIRNKTGGGVRKGSVAGRKKHNGYIEISINNKRYYAHRLAWLIYYGFWPECQIDHINGVRDDNRICNLRIATNMQNQYNAKKPKNNTSGVKGVYWQKQVKKWQAYCDVNGKRYHLGLFSDIERARLSVMKFREKMHKEFCNHGE